MGKQKIDKCNEIVFGHRSTSQPHSRREAEWKSTTGEETLCIFVSSLPSKLFRLLSNRVFICFCFVGKAHRKPKWIWKHLHGCPRGAAALLLPPLADFQRPENSFATQTMTIWMENGTRGHYVPGSRFQGAARVPRWCWARVANWGVHGENDLEEQGWIAIMRCYSGSHEVNISWVEISLKNGLPFPLVSL